ncbi:MAG: hypothetical protein ACFCU1_03935 [Sumerlaeia bacterium]
MAIIRAGLGSWVLPTSRHKPIKAGDQLKVSFSFEPFLCIQETNEQPRMTSLVGFLYELHGIVLETQQDYWQLMCGVPLICEQTPYPWLFKGQSIQVFGKLNVYLEPSLLNQYLVTVRNISSYLPLFKQLQMDNNQRIIPGASTISTREEILEYGAQFPPKKIEEIPFPRRFSGLDYYCFDLELSLGSEKKNFY